MRVLRLIWMDHFRLAEAVWLLLPEPNLKAEKDFNTKSNHRIGWYSQWEETTQELTINASSGFDWICLLPTNYNSSVVRGTKRTDWGTCWPPASETEAQGFQGPKLLRLHRFKSWWGLLLTVSVPTDCRQRAKTDPQKPWRAAKSWSAVDHEVERHGW